MIARRISNCTRRGAAAFGLAGFVFAMVLPLAATAQVKGDLNEDGLVDISDGTMLSRIVAGHLSPTVLSDQTLADVAPIVSGVGGDGVLTIADAVVMLRALSEFDVDGDGLNRTGENLIGSSPFLADTDGDGILDPDDPNPTIPGPPGQPDDLRIFDGSGNVTITFSTPAGPLGSYLIHRYGSNGEYAYFTAEGTATSFVDDTAAGGTVYFYWIQPVSPVGEEGNFVDCDITDPANASLWLTGAIGQVPNPFFTATVNGSNVDLAWEQSGASGVVGYRVYQSATPVPLGSTTGLNLVHTANGIGTTGHTRTGLASGTYYFRITAFTTTIESRLDSAKQVVVVVP